MWRFVIGAAECPDRHTTMRPNGPTRQPVSEVPSPDRGVVRGCVGNRGGRRVVVAAVVLAVVGRGDWLTVVGAGAAVVVVVVVVVVVTGAGGGGGGAGCCGVGVGVGVGVAARLTLVATTAARSGSGSAVGSVVGGTTEVACGTGA